MSSKGNMLIKCGIERRRVGLSVCVAGVLLFLTLTVFVNSRQSASPFGIVQDWIQPIAQETKGASQHEEEPTSVPLQCPETNNSRNYSSSGPEVKVILLTYMRAGSTFTGDVFNHHPQVFYFLRTALGHRLPLPSRKGTSTLFHQDEMEYQEQDHNQLPYLQSNVLRSALGCEFQHMYTKPLSVRLHAVKSCAFQPFQACKDHHPGLLGLYACVPVLRRACASAKVTVMKVVRAPMKVAATLLKADPKVKVIHLVRDPRPLLLSRERTGFSGLYPLTARQFCDKVVMDLKDSIPLKAQYPGRVLTARYEDLAEQPLAFTSKLFSFATLDMTPTLRDYVIQMTSSNDPRIREAAFGTQRSNSSHTAATWRETVKMGFVQYADSVCRELYQLAGYLLSPVSNA